LTRSARPAGRPAGRSISASLRRGSARALAGSLSKMAESSGPAPQALRLETASNRSPRFAVLLSKKVAEARGHAPQRPAAAQSASNGCWHLGQFDSLRLPSGSTCGRSISAWLRHLQSLRGRICTYVSPLRRRRPELLGHAEMERGSAKMAQPEQSEGEPSGRPLAGGSANKMDLAAGLARARALGASPRAYGTPVGLLASLTRWGSQEWWVRSDSHRHCSAFEARLTIYCRRTRKNGPFTRTCTSISSFARSRPSFWTMKGKYPEIVWSLSPESHRPVRFTRPARRSLRLTGMVAAPGNAPGPGAHLARFRV
jgi:hypothetical protein